MEFTWRSQFESTYNYKIRKSDSTIELLLNTSYATDSYFLYVLKIEYGWNLWLKVLSIMCTYITNSFIEIPPCAKKAIFSTEFVLLDLYPPFFEVNQEVWKRPCAWRNFKNIFCVLSTYPKKPFRTEKPSIWVWASGLLGVNERSDMVIATMHKDYNFSHDQLTLQWGLISFNLYYNTRHGKHLILMSLYRMTGESLHLAPR